MNAVTDVPFDSRVIATYSSSEKVDRAKTILKTKLGLGSSNIKLITPNDDAIGKKLEGSSRQVGKSMLRSHFIYALLGLAVGIVLAALLVEYGPALTRNNPLFTYIAFSGPALYIVTIGGGVKALKPQHDPVNMKAVKAKEEGCWSLMVSTENTSITKDDIVEELKHTDCTKLEAK